MSMFKQHMVAPTSAVGAHERRVLRPATAQLDEHGDGRSTPRQTPPLRVYRASAAVETAAPLAEPMAAFQEPVPNLPTADAVSIQAVREPVAAEMEQMAINLRNAVGRRHPMLMSAADQIFGAGGKRLRPMIVFLVGKATCAAASIEHLTDRHLRLAEITEMIHTASLLHDDVLDDCDTRRGMCVIVAHTSAHHHKPGSATVNSTYGSRIAILTGDFLFAQSSWGLAQLDNLEVIKLISQVIADFADGEISQAVSLFDTELTLQQYLDKSFYKTASLIAASCRGAAVFSEMGDDVKQRMFDYGKHLGLAFQVVDDILDYTQSAEQLGKPQVGLTASVIHSRANVCGCFV